MYTSFEERLSLLQQVHQGSEAFQAKIPESVITKGDEPEYGITVAVFMLPVLTTYLYS